MRQLTVSPGALANVLEVSLVEFLLQELSAAHGFAAQRGTERRCPDIEITGAPFADVAHAIDIKAARRKVD